MYIGVNGIKLWYEKRGEGRPLLLLHGNGEDHSIFSSLATALEDEFCIYLPDTRCHGKSDDPKGISYGAMTRDIADFIRFTGMEKPICLGFSDGGIVGLMLAIEYPELLGGLITCGANTKPCGLSANYRIMCELKHFFTRDKLLKLMIDEPSIEVGSLAKIQIPTLVIAGEKDLIRENETRKIAGAIPGAELYVFEGESHDSYVSGCALLAPQIRRFVRENGLD
ncbi:MAG: alpha/beta hydrolase [Clostridia bacterium]|nr:alpha/beta hydrolase [Clostridia bacterium]